MSGFMSKRVENKILMFCVWSGAAFLVLTLIGVAPLAHFLPLPSPDKDPAFYDALYMQNLSGVRAGMVVMMFGAAFIVPFSAALINYVSRIEGKFGPLSVMLTMGCMADVILFFYPALWWEVVCFRPDRDPQLVYLLSDFCWLQWVGAITIFLPMPLSVAVAAFADNSAKPVFPRWLGYFTLFVTLTILPDQLVYFFHSGPFAWNGLFGIYLPLTDYGIWWVIVIFLLRNAVKADAASLDGSIALGDPAGRLSAAE